jgi:hypothetical protein
MRWRKRAKPARRYICRLIILVLVFAPSVRPLWNGRVTAAVAAANVRALLAGSVEPLADVVSRSRKARGLLEHRDVWLVAGWDLADQRPEEEFAEGDIAAEGVGH